MADEKRELPWDPAEDPKWAAAVTAWPWHRIGGDDYAKSGKCPRCRHPIGPTLEHGNLTNAAADAEPEALLFLAAEGPIVLEDANDSPFFASCDCSVEHPGRPDSIKRGCGRWAYIPLPPQS